MEFPVIHIAKPYLIEEAYQNIGRRDIKTDHIWNELGDSK